MKPTGDLADRLARGTAVNIGGAVFGKIAELVTIAVVLDRVGRVAFGIVVIAQALSLWPSLLEKGVGQTLMRVVAGRESDERFAPMLAAGHIILVLIGAATLVGGFLFSHLAFVSVVSVPPGLRQESVIVLDLLVIAAGLRLATGLVWRALLGEMRLATMRAIEILRVTVTLLATLALVEGHASSMTTVAGAMLLGDLAATAVAMLTTRPRRRLGLRWRDADARAFAEQWRNAKPMLAASAIGLIWTRADPLIVGVALGPAAVATYGVVMRVFEATLGAVEMVYLGLMPATATLIEEGDRPRVARLLQRAASYAAALVWPAAVVAALFSRELTQVWLGRSLPQVRSAMAAAMVLAILLTLTTGMLAVILGAGRAGAVVRVQVGAVCVNLALSIALVKPLGISAVFIGTIVSNMLVMARMFSLVAEISGSTAPHPISELLAGFLRPAVLVGGLALALGVLHLLLPSGGAVVVGVGVASALLAVYGLAALWWVVPRQDLRRLWPWDGHAVGATPQHGPGD